MAKSKEQEPILAPDAFQQEGASWIQWLEKNLKVVLGGIVVLLAAVIGLEYAQSHSERSAALVTAELDKAVDAYAEATDLRKVLTSTSAAVLNAEFEAAAKKLAAVASGHPGTDAARMAKLYEADLLARLGKHADAEAGFRAYTDSAKPDDELLFFALEGLGLAQEAQDKKEDAVATFDRLGSARPFAKVFALKHKGRIQEAKGDTAAALATYEAMATAIADQMTKKYGGAPPPNAAESSLERFAKTRIDALKK
jgi:predicted negative regulator of RcsB-dependent stress response